MIRKAVRTITEQQNHQIKLSRTQNGRPYLLNYNQHCNNHASPIKYNIENNNSPNNSNNHSIFDNNNIHNPSSTNNNNNLQTKPNNINNNSSTTNINTTFDFNISHDAEMVVLACEDTRVGVDVMEIARPG